MSVDIGDVPAILGQAKKYHAEGNNTIRKYTCPYCNYTFTAEVKDNYSSGGSKHARVTSSVPCPKCKNFLKVRDNSISEVLTSWN